MCERELGVGYVSTGQLFREEIKKETPLGRKAQSYVSKGELVPDELVIEIMTRRLALPELETGFILDGFPRTAVQAEGLDRALSESGRPLHGAVYIASPQELLIRRLGGRLVCAKCGANFHRRTMKPKVAGKCDHCDGELITRKDDEPETIRQRLEIDSRNAAPLLKYYRDRKLLHRIDGRGRIQTVFEKRAIPLFKKQGWI